MTISLTQILLDFISRAHEHNSYDALAEDFARTASAIGFDFFMIARLPELERLSKRHILANTWPHAWLERYNQKAYFEFDPVTLWSRRSTRAFTWSEARSKYPTDARTSQIASEAQSIGLVDGIAFQLGDVYCTRSVFSVATGQTIDLPISIWPMIHLAAQQFQQRALQLRAAGERIQGHLTRRERDVLAWTAVGKTYWETSCILGVSQKTVEVTLSHVRRKLEASNTAHAIAKALASGQIRL